MDKTLVLGIGNAICGDDGLGVSFIRAARLDRRFREAALLETQEAPIRWLDRIAPYNKLIIIDSQQGQSAKPGRIRRLVIKDLLDYKASFSVHSMGIVKALGIGRSLGLGLPQSIVVYTVAVGKNDGFHTGLSEEVGKAVPKLVALVGNELKKT